MGPLSYPDYKPSMHSSFDTKYVERVQRFVRQGLLGDAAAVLPGKPTPTAGPEAYAHLNTGVTSNIYSHLLKESSMHVRTHHDGLRSALRVQKTKMHTATDFSPRLFSHASAIMLPLFIV